MSPAGTTRVGPLASITIASTPASTRRGSELPYQRTGTRRPATTRNTTAAMPNASNRSQRSIASCGLDSSSSNPRQRTIQTVLTVLLPRGRPVDRPRSPMSMLHADVYFMMFG